MKSFRLLSVAMKIKKLEINKISLDEFARKGCLFSKPHISASVFTMLEYFCQELRMLLTFAEKKPSHVFHFYKMHK